MEDDLVERLLEGNRRFVARRCRLDASPQRRLDVAQGQKPFAMVLGCVDSRVPPELIFDQGLGELFVVRTAGEALDRAALGSLEFGMAEMHIPLLVVLGHRRCGAVKAAMEVLEGKGEAEADIAFLVESLTPAVERGKRLAGDVWEQSARAQVSLQVDRLRRSPVLAPAVQAGALRVLGAWYELDTGVVEITRD